MASIWDRIRVWFHDSETLVWARLQVLGGIVFTTLATTDPDVIKGAVDALNLTRWWPLLLIAAGVVTELVRRSREPHDLGVKTVADLKAVDAVPPATNTAKSGDKM